MSKPVIPVGSWSPGGLHSEPMAVRVRSGRNSVDDGGTEAGGADGDADEDEEDKEEEEQTKLKSNNLHADGGEKDVIHSRPSTRRMTRIWFFSLKKVGKTYKNICF